MEYSSRAQGLQLEKASGEAALEEGFVWFHWEGFVDLGRPELKPEVGRKVQAQSSLRLSGSEISQESKQCHHSAGSWLQETCLSCQPATVECQQESSCGGAREYEYDTDHTERNRWLPFGMQHLKDNDED